MKFGQAFIEICVVLSGHRVSIVFLIYTCMFYNFTNLRIVVFYESCGVPVNRQSDCLVEVVYECWRITRFNHTTWAP